MDILVYFHHSCHAPMYSTVQFQFTARSLDLLDNVLHDSYHSVYMYISKLFVIIKLLNSTDESLMVDDRLLKGNHLL